MQVPMNPAATDPVPSFITAPGATDVLMVAVAIFLIVAVVAFGVLFFRLHTLPERIAHKTRKLQFEIVAVLGLIALFTHMHIFWVIGLLLALIDIPEFGSLLDRIATGIEGLATVKSPGAVATGKKDERSAGVSLARETEAKERTVPADVCAMGDVEHV